VLGLSATTVDLGTVDSVWRLDLRGVGTAPVDVVVGNTPAWLAVVPKQRRVDPGADVPLTITLDRKTAPAGPVDLTVPVGARNGVGGADLRIRARVDGSPRIVSVTSAPARIVRSGCRPAAGAGAVAGAAGAGAAAGAGVTQATVTVTADDGTGVFAVELTVSLPDGRTQSQALSLGTASGTRSTWTGQLASTQEPGTITYTAAVTDLNGRRSHSPGSLVVLPCPS
jgi:hypothetical protein